MYVLDGFLMLTLILLTALSLLGVFFALDVSVNPDADGGEAIIVFVCMLLFAGFLTLTISFGVIHDTAWLHDSLASVFNGPDTD